MESQQANVLKVVLLFSILLFIGLMSASITYAQAYTFVTKWGTGGTANGTFSSPWDIATDSSGNVYVADTFNNRIQKFDNNGTYITQWGSEGAGNGQFYSPYGVAVDSLGNVYVADTSNNRIQKFDSNGTYVTQWGSGPSSTNGQFYNPHGVAVDSLENVYVADTTNERIQKFDSNGTYITQWGGGVDTANGTFSSPWDIATDSSGNVYVADTFNNRIQKFDSNGTYITQWGYEGAGNGQFYSPYGVAVDSLDNVYVADTSNNRIQKFDSNGTYVTQWGSGPSSTNGQFYNPHGVAVDSLENVYVADTTNERIQKFSGPNSYLTGIIVGPLLYTYSNPSHFLGPGQSLTATATVNNTAPGNSPENLIVSLDNATSIATGDLANATTALVWVDVNGGAETAPTGTDYVLTATGMELYTGQAAIQLSNTTSPITVGTDLMPLPANATYTVHYLLTVSPSAPTTAQGEQLEVGTSLTGSEP